MPRKTQRPHDPAAGTAARLQRLARAEAEERLSSSAPPETWGVAEAPLALPANAAVTTARDGRGRVAHAHRSDVFERLHGRGALSDAGLAAARRLERDVGLRAGRFRPASLVLVDSQGSAAGATERMVEAGRRVEAALATLGARQAALLRALVEPPMLRGELVDWRAATLRETGEKTPHGQATAVRLACEDLASTYKSLDRAPRR
jgi:hypothetical protein